MSRTRKRTSEIEFAVQVARDSGLLAAIIQNDAAGGQLEKADRSPVTIADFAVQALVAHRLAERFPRDPLVAEEDTEILATPQGRQVLERVTGFLQGFIGNPNPDSVRCWIGEGRSTVRNRYWTLDPIDGTKGFLRGDQYVTALALVEEGEVVLGVLACPNLDTCGQPSKDGSLWAAVRGEGTWASPMEEEGPSRRIQVSSVSSGEQARVLRSVVSTHTNVEVFDRILLELGTDRPPLLMDSQAKYAALASGQADLLFRLPSRSRPDYREKIWDQAAGSIILEEAGGRVTDLMGRKLDFSCGRTLEKNRGILASNSHLHERALRTVTSLD